MPKLPNRLIPMLVAAMLLTGNAYASELPEPVTSVTDITPMESAVQREIPAFLPLDIQTKTEDGVKLLVKTYEVSPDVEPQDLIEQDLSRSGVAYTLRDILCQNFPGITESKDQTQSVTISSESDKQVDTLTLLPESLNYAENGFTGQLVLDAGTITSEVESTSSYSYTVKESREFHGLSRNDPALIPKTLEKHGQTLTLCDIRWQGGSENDPAPIYSATAVYAGKAYGSKANGYLVTARYSGTVLKEVPGNMLYTLVYEAVPIPILPPSFDWTPVVLTTGILVLIGGIGVPTYRILRKSGKLRRPVKTVLAEPRPVRRKPRILKFMKRDGGNTNG